MIPEHDARDGTGHRLLRTLEHLLAIPALEVKTALDQASSDVAEALVTDKVDAFLYDPAIDSLVAVGSSDTPMSRLQRQLGLDRVPLTNGGTVAEVYKTSSPFFTGHAEQEPSMLRGDVDALGIRSLIAVPLLVAGERHGVLSACSAQPEHFTGSDLQFLEAVAQWVGMVVHRAELSEHVTQEATERARRTLADELLLVLAHDLRTPLTAAQGYLDLLHRRVLREGRQPDIRYVEQVGQALRRLQSMIAALLDVSRLDQGLFTLNTQPVDLVPLVRETVETLRLPGIAIETRGLDDIVLEQADRERLRQALENLIGNALQHAPVGTTVEITISQEQREGTPWVVISIRDEGPGIAPSLLATIFERFVRGPESQSLGLGLYLAHGIALAHKGSLTVDSTLGLGTTFHLALPLTAVPA